MSLLPVGSQRKACRVRHKRGFKGERRLGSEDGAWRDTQRILEHRSLACVGSDPAVSPLSSHPVQNEELCNYCAVENSPLQGRVLLSLGDFI